jgi:hypothetical protein
MTAAPSPAAAVHAAADPHPEQAVIAAFAGGAAFALLLRLITGRRGRA